MFIFHPQEVLSDMFGVQDIPSFVVLGADGKVVTTEGRGKVEADPTGASFPAGWLPQPINDVNDDPGPLNEETCFLVFAPSEASAAAITAVAKETHAAAGGVIDDMPCQFFTAKDGGVMAQLRRLTEQPDAKDRLVILDIPAGGKYHVCRDAGAVTQAFVREMVAQHKAGALERSASSR